MNGEKICCCFPTWIKIPLHIELDVTYYKKCNEKPHPHPDSELKNSNVNTFIKG